MTGAHWGANGLALLPGRRAGRAGRGGAGGACAPGRSRARSRRCGAIAGAGVTWWTRATTPTRSPWRGAGHPRRSRVPAAHRGADRHAGAGRRRARPCTQALAEAVAAAGVSTVLLTGGPRSCAHLWRRPAARPSGARGRETRRGAGAPRCVAAVRRRGRRDGEGLQGLEGVAWSAAALLRRRRDLYEKRGRGLRLNAVFCSGPCAWRRRTVITCRSSTSCAT